MADQSRGPLLVGRRDVPVQRASIIFSSSLLATTLAVAGQIPLPLGAAHVAPAQVIHPAHRNFVNPDTSQGTPKTLIADARNPQFSSLSQAAQQHPRNELLNADTSRSQPVTLRVVATPAPLVNVPSHGPDQSARRVNGDTSRSAWAVLQPLAAAPPLVNPVQVSPAKFWWQPDDTSAGTPKQLIADAVAPLANAVHFSVDRLRPVVAATLPSPAPLLQPVLPSPPVVNAVHLVPPKFWWQPDDTSAGTPKPATADAVAPLVNVAFLGVDRARPVADTSRGMSAALAVPPPPAPFVATPQSQTDRTRPVVDTSKASPLALLNQALLPPPLVNLPHMVPPRFWWQPADTSAGMPKVVKPDRALPFATVPQRALDMSRLTSIGWQGSPPGTLAAITYARAPSGGGFQRQQATSARPDSDNTERFVQTPTRRL